MFLKNRLKNLFVLLGGLGSVVVLGAFLLLQSKVAPAQSVTVPIGTPETFETEEIARIKFLEPGGRPGHGGASETRDSSATSASAAATDAPARAKVIRELIEKYKEWGAGGHSPIPTRAINANTFAKVRRETSATDAPALKLLLLDDANDIRWMAATLLECFDPNAEQEVEDLLKKETNRARQNRLYEARTTILVNRAGGTSCK